jgi:hypothetical protein
MLAMVFIVGAILSGCGSSSPSSTRGDYWAVTITRQSGQIMTVTVDDPSGLIEGVAPGTTPNNSEIDLKAGLAITQAVGDPTRLLVTWRGHACPTTKVNLAVASDRGVAIALREPRDPGGCTNDLATVKTIEVKFRAAVPDDTVVGTLLPP